MVPLALLLMEAAREGRIVSGGEGGQACERQSEKEKTSEDNDGC